MQGPKIVNMSTYTHNVCKWCKGSKKCYGCLGIGYVDGGEACEWCRTEAGVCESCISGAYIVIQVDLDNGEYAEFEPEPGEIDALNNGAWPARLNEIYVKEYGWPRLVRQVANEAQ